MRSGRVLFIGVATLLLAGAGRLAYLELAEGEAARERARRQHTARLTIQAQRGDILDTRGRLLAGSVRRPSVFVDPSLLEDPRDLRYAACSVAPVLGLDAGELAALLRERRESQFVWVKRAISEQELEHFNAVREGRRLYAFGVQHELQRTYPHGRLAAHVLGFVGDPDQNGVAHGQAGIEQAFDQVMLGTDGHRVATVDRRRRRVRPHPDEYVLPRDGAIVVLTIDAYVQEQTELHLRNAVDVFKAEWGIAVVIDPCSGEILAMASVPGFDPAQPVPPGLSDKQRLQAEARVQNRTIAHAYEPGSVFKPFIAACAYDEGLVGLDDVFRINGPARAFGSRTIHDTHAYGSLPLHEIISRSSNIGMSLVGSRCGNARLDRYVRLFGFGDPTGITLPGEHPGLVQDFSRWTSYSTRSIPMGQEIAVTGVQIVAAFSVFSNGGVLYRPRIVRGVIRPDGTVLADYSPPVAIRRVLSPDSVRRFREEALVEVVISDIGTGKKARIPNYRVFGKTGTAQIAPTGGGGYLPEQYVGSFVGGAPSDDPRVVALVSLYHPSAGKHGGGTVAAPAVGAILADTLHYMGVPHEVTSAGSGRIMSRSANP